MWVQILGKIRLVHAPHIRSSDGGVRHVALEPKPVADFYTETMSALQELGIRSDIQATPNEVDPAIPFAGDRAHRSYDADAAHRFWRQLVSVDGVLHQFRARYVAKASPVHIFWGAMDLACTRFTGRTAPKHPGGMPNCGDCVMEEGYSHELSSCGFWPGGGEEGAFYSYTYPAPDGFADYQVAPREAFYSKGDGEFLLPYEVVRAAANPEQTLLDFLQSTYEAAAELGHWDRASLEVDPGRWDHKRRSH